MKMYREKEKTVQMFGKTFGKCEATSSPRRILKIKAVGKGSKRIHFRAIVLTDPSFIRTLQVACRVCDQSATQENLIMAEMQVLANMKQRIEKLVAEVQGVQKGM